jgi:C4-dicarboxylate-specific signal transduction histidine kinase
VNVIERNYEKDLLSVSGHAPKLEQVFLDLILNARNAMTRSNTLEVVTTESNIDLAYISFCGTDIAPNHFAKVYNSFYHQTNWYQRTDLTHSLN